jgi:hypothetical protein
MRRQIARLATQLSDSIAFHIRGGGELRILDACKKRRGPEAPEGGVADGWLLRLLGALPSNDG